MQDINIRQLLVGFMAIVISLTVHEFAHAIMADRLGDSTPRRHGRLTLNPMVLFKAHPFGALIVPFFGALQGFLIGWAATPVNPAQVRRTISLRKAEFLIAFAGPASNIVLAVISALIWVALYRAEQPFLQPFEELSRLMVFANIFLALLNLMPIPPLDGFTVLRTISPHNPAIPFIEQYSLIILLLFFIYAGRIFQPIMTMTTKALSWLLMMTM